MPGRINEHDIEALRERADLAVIVGGHTALTRNGTRLKGLCPFHSEKTPSFTVDAARGFFHCFGCGEGGDVYGFLQKAEALSFPEAVERLARIVGYELRYEELSPGQRRALGRRTRTGQAVSEAAAFYAARLRSDEGGPARAYLRTRGLSDADLETFGLGWAPDAWDALTRHLLGAGFDVAEIIDAGVASHGRQGPVDRFRGRITFPIRDASGADVVAFGGRLVPGVTLRTGGRDGTPPKYINSSETEVYRKSRVLYGLDLARAEAARRQVVLVVEGYMDVIALHLAGVRNTVATCGTALTADHFRVLERHAPRVILALDADEAGYAAAERARGLAEEVGVREVAVLPLPAGQDPADLAAGGPDVVERALRGVVTAVEFQIGHLLRTADLASPEGQVAAYRRTFPLLAGIGDRALRYRYIRDVVAPAVRLNADLIEGELDATPAPGAAPAPAPRQQAPQAGPGDLGAGAQRDPQAILERSLLQIALQRPDLLPEAWRDVTDDEFRLPVARQLFAQLRRRPPGDLEGVLAGLPDDDLRRQARGIALDELTVTATRPWAAELLANFRSAAIQRELDDVHAQLAATNRGTDAGRQGELQRRELELLVRRMALREGRSA